MAELNQWFKNGDHPDDYKSTVEWFSDKGIETYTGQHAKDNDWEGQVVRRFRHPEISGKTVCDKCRKTMHDHGWIDSGGEGQIVCPGDYILTENGAYTVATVGD